MIANSFLESNHLKRNRPRAKYRNSSEEESDTNLLLMMGKASYGALQVLVLILEETPLQARHLSEHRLLETHLEELHLLEERHHLAQD